MANQVFNTVTIETLEGEELVLRPMEIKRKREFFKIMKKYTDLISEIMEQMVKIRENSPDKVEAIDDSGVLDVMVEMVALSLKKSYPDFVKKTNNRFVWIEENIDEDTMYKIIEVCAGVNLKTNQEDQEKIAETLMGQAGTTQTQYPLREN